MYAANKREENMLGELEAVPWILFFAAVLGCA